MQEQAISYQRFSDKRQKKGDSERRQNDAFHQFCQRFNLEAVEVMVDRGLSGFHGEHRTKGHFGRFLAAVRANKIGKNKVLVIENWDRFSREKPHTALATIAEILQVGVGIGVCNLGMILREEDLDTPKMQWVMGDLIRAREESKRRSTLIKASWIRRRTRATKACPSWIIVKDGQHTLHPEKAKLLRKAVSLAIDGYGCETIRQKLGMQGSFWSGLSIIFRSRCLIGEYQPRKRTNGKDMKETSGDAIPGYYPAVIDEATFYRLQRAMDSRKGHRGRRGKFVRCLFTGLIHDISDGSPMVIYKGHTDRKTGEAVPVLKGNNRRNAHRKHVYYHVVEAAVLKFLWELQVTDLQNKEVSPELGKLEAKVGDLTHKIQETQQRLLESGGDTSIMLTTLQVLDKARTEAVKQLEAARKKAHNPDTDSLNEAQTIGDALKAATGQDLYDLRSKLKGLLASMIDKILVTVKDSFKADLVIKFRCGLVRGIWIDREQSGLFVPKGFKEGEFAMSLKDLQMIRQNPA